MIFINASLLGGRSVSQPFFNILLHRAFPSQTAVGLFNAEVRTHLVIFANRGSEEYPQLKEKLATLAPEFTGKVESLPDTLLLQFVLKKSVNLKGSI